MTTISIDINHIVAGTSLEETSLDAVREALRLGARFGAKVTVVHITSQSKDDPALQQAFDDHLAALTLPDGVQVIKEVYNGSGIAGPLAEFAEKVQAQLICVGPRARGFVERHITGGPAQQLLSRTTLPTLVVNGPSHIYQHVVVAVDLSPASAQALAFGARLLEGDDQRLVALHVLTSRDGAYRIAAIRDDDTVAKALLEKTRKRVELFVQDHLSERVPFTAEIRVGAVGHMLRNVVDHHQADLVCMGTAGRSGLLGWLAGNTAEQVVRNITTSTLVVYS